MPWLEEPVSVGRGESESNWHVVFLGNGLEVAAL